MNGCIQIEKLFHDVRYCSFIDVEKGMLIMSTNLFVLCI